MRNYTPPKEGYSMVSATSRVYVATRRSIAHRFDRKRNLGMRREQPGTAMDGTPGNAEVAYGATRRGERLPETVGLWLCVGWSKMQPSAAVCPHCSRTACRSRRRGWRDFLSKAIGRYPYRCRICNYRFCIADGRIRRSATSTPSCGWTFPPCFMGACHGR